MTLQWPPEIIDEIVGALGHDPHRWAYGQVSLRETLLECTRVSRPFYHAARRRLWQNLHIAYYPYYVTANASCDRLYDVLKANPDLVADVHTLFLDFSPDHPDVDHHEDPEASRARVEQGPVHTGLTKSLTLLASAGRVNELFLTSELKIAGADYGVDMQRLDPEILFALTALRCTPSLRNCYFHYLRNPPLSVLFGNPSNDSVGRVVFFHGLYESGVNHVDIIVPRDSPSLDITDDSYNAALDAVSKFDNPVVLFPKVKQLTLFPFAPFWTYFQELPVIDASKPNGGHIPLLEDFKHRAPIGDDTSAASRLLHTNPGLRKVYIDSIQGCGTLRNFDNLPLLSHLHYHLNMYGVGHTRPGNLENYLGQFIPLLTAIPMDHPLETLTIECAFLTYSAEECQDMLKLKHIWSVLDDALVNVGSRLKRAKNNRLRVLLDFKLVFGGLYDYQSLTSAQGMKEVLEMAQLVLPAAKASEGIELDIGAEILTVGQYPADQFEGYL